MDRRGAGPACRMMTRNRHNGGMDVRSRPVTVRGDAQRFTGDVWMEPLVHADPPSRLRINLVHFAPGGRTAWHVHAVGQTLIVTDGVGRVQARGGEVREVRAGDTIVTPPGEWHWHGAAPGHVMTHLAIWEAPDPSVPENEWGAAVTDDEYRATPAAGAQEPVQAAERERVPGPWTSGPASQS